MIESLEARALFSVSAGVDAGLLVVQGGDDADVIRLTVDGSGIRVEDQNGVVGTFDGVASARIDGGAGDDQLIVSANVAIPVTLLGGAGADTLVAQGTAATFEGGAGTDAFWAGAKTTLTINDMDAVERSRKVNRLPATFSTVPIAAASKKTVGASIPRDPGLTRAAWGTADFSDHPLFAQAGPSLADIAQGQLNDCYLMASLASVADADPSAIRQTITDLGDGTYAVRLMKGKTAKYYHVDADLPVIAGSTDALAYAGLGAESSLWAALVEKAYALASGGSYSKLDHGGWMANVYTSLGESAKSYNGWSKGATSLLTFVSNQLDAGKALTLGTEKKLRNSPLIGNHAYAIIGVEGNSLVLANPLAWDGIVTVPANVVARAISGVVVATVA